MSRESRGIGEDAIEELEPREEWPLENNDVVGEVRVNEDVEASEEEAAGWSILDR